MTHLGCLARVWLPFVPGIKSDPVWFRLSRILAISVLPGSRLSFNPVLQFCPVPLQSCPLSILSPFNPPFNHVPFNLPSILPSFNPVPLQSCLPSILPSFNHVPFNPAFLHVPFNLPSILSFNPFPLQSFPPSILSPFNPAFLQSCLPSILSPFNPAFLQSYPPVYILPQPLPSLHPNPLQWICCAGLQSGTTQVCHELTL